MKKLLAVIFVMIMAVSMFACADGNKDKLTVTTPDGTTEKTESGDYLPDVNYGGAEFRISTKQNTLYEVFTDAEDSTDIIESALILRNNTVENKYGIKIKPVITASSDLDTQVNEISANV